MGRMPKKLKEAIERGDLIPHEKVFNSYSKEEQASILKKVRYLRAAIALRKTRRKLGLSQAELARKMGVQREFISRIESGQQNVTLETLYRIAEATGKEFHFTFK